MKRDEFLINVDVKRFVEWAGYLVKGDWSLAHQWKTQERYGGNFSCVNLYGAYRGYSWHHLSIDETMGLFADWRKKFENFGAIETPDDKDEFLRIARAIAVDWGGSTTLDLWSSSNWGDMAPAKLQEHIDQIRQKLDPAKADTKDLPVSLRMGAGFSKIYSALIPGLPIYDSRVACALACLVRLYHQCRDLPSVPSLLDLGIPSGRGNDDDRCKKPSLQYPAKYARSNLQFAWLMQALVEYPGDFAAVPETQRVDALQSALFMLGYARLPDDAVVKNR